MVELPHARLAAGAASRISMASIRGTNIMGPEEAFVDISPLSRKMMQSKRESFQILIF